MLIRASISQVTKSLETFANIAQVWQFLRGRYRNSNTYSCYVCTAMGLISGHPKNIDQQQHGSMCFNENKKVHIAPIPEFSSWFFFLF